MKNMQEKVFFDVRNFSKQIKMPGLVESRDPQKIQNLGLEILLSTPRLTGLRAKSVFCAFLIM